MKKILCAETGQLGVVSSENRTGRPDKAEGARSVTRFNGQRIQKARR